MKAAIFRAERQVELGERPDPTIEAPTDVVVRVVRGCVCGSDLWYFRGVNQHKVGSIGHEFIGVVDQVGDGITPPWSRFLAAASPGVAAAGLAGPRP